MKSVEPNARLRRAVRGFYAWIGAFAVAVAAPSVSNALIESNSTAGRVLGVVTGVVGWVPSLLVVAAVIARGDEFQRRIHMTAIALTFAGALLLISALDWLVRAKFIAPPQLSVVWLIVALFWFFAIIGAKRHYER